MRSLLARLLTVVTLALLPAMAFQIYSIIEAHHAREQASRSEALRLVGLVTSQQRAIVEGVRQTLITLGYAPAFRNPEPSLCQAFLTRLVEGSPSISWAASLGLDGTVLCASDDAERGRSLSDRPWFRQARDTGRFVTGGYVAASGSHHAGVVFARPYMTDSGRPAGVLCVMLDLDWLGKQVSQLPLPPTVVVSVSDAQGIILARTQDAARFIGSPQSADQLVELAGTQVQVGSAEGVKGVPGIVGYVPPDGGPAGLLIRAGFEEGQQAAMLTRADRRALFLLAFGAALAFGATLLGGSVLIRRPTVRLLAAAERWRTGDLSPRTGLRPDAGEFGRLATAFDDMAASLQAREQALRTALESTTDSVVVLDRDWRYVYLNQRAIAQIAGGRNLLGQVIWDAFPEAADSPFGTAYREAVEDGVPTHAEAYFASLDIRFEVHAYPSQEGLTIFFRDVSEQRKTESALRVAQSRATEILESISDAFYAIDAQWRFTYVNHHAAALFGRTQQELLGRPLLEAFPEVAGSLSIEMYAQVMADHTRREFETLSPILKGWTHFIAYPQVDGGLAVYFHDITGRKNAETALQESEKRLGLAINAAQLGIWEWDVTAAALRIDERSAEISGGLLPARKWIPTGGADPATRHEAVHLDDWAAREAALADLIEGRAEAREVEYRLRRPGRGGWAWIINRGIVAARDPASGKPIRIVGVVRDITEERVVELERQQLLRTIDLAPFVACDMDGMIQFWSKGCERLFGFTAEQALGSRLHDLLQTDVSGSLADIEPALLSSGDWTGDLVQRRHDGTEITIAAHEVLLRDEAGHPLSVIISVADVTALRQAQAELRRLNLDLEARVREEVATREATQAELAQAQKVQALGELAAGIAHDFNNILQAVSGAAMLIEHRADDAGRVRELVRMTLDATGRGASITQRLLSFSHRTEFRTEPLAPGPVLQALREVLAQMPGSTINVEALAPVGLARVLADRAQLETALINLGTNARDAMPNGGTLTLAADAEAVREGEHHSAGLMPGRYVRISVSDSGDGMDAAHALRAGEPFFTTKPVGRGTGLGLAMVRRFVEQSGGGLEISSEPGRGTTVRLWLPQAAEQAVPAEQVRRPEAISARVVERRTTPSILLVDDDDLVRETLAAHLEDSGYAVRTAASGAQALAVLDSGAGVDVLVSDLSMPGMDGIVTIREAHERRPGLPAVLLTGYAGRHAALEAEQGAFLLLRKPIYGAVLANTLEGMLATSRAA
jgi:PAS domain S-box-containing protein